MSPSDSVSNEESLSASSQANGEQKDDAGAVESPREVLKSNEGSQLSSSGSNVGNGPSLSQKEFLASMTFAATTMTTTSKTSATAPSTTTTTSLSSYSRGGMCDCDECGIPQQFIPAPIAEAIARYKKKRRLGEFIETGSSTAAVASRRLQSRTLRKRHGQLSVWEWTLPCQAEPLVEYGSNHRLVWIVYLPNVLKSIANGIVGSQAEQQARKLLPWKQGDVWFVPSNGGRAMGYVHVEKTNSTINKDDEPTNSSSMKKDTPDATTSSSSIYATLVIVKIPVALVETLNGDDETSQGWHSDVRHIARKILQTYGATTPDSSSQPLRLEEVDAQQIREALKSG